MRRPAGATSNGADAATMSANLSRRSTPRARPINVLQSFAKIDYGRIYNGGPITIALRCRVRDAESLTKVALLVRTFARLGCQQLQLNTVNVDTLLDAKRHRSATTT